jgi:hypothetical protein
MNGAVLVTFGHQAGRTVPLVLAPWLLSADAEADTMADRSDEARDTKRQGDILGLGGVTGGDHAVNSLGTDDEQRRRRRMREGADNMVTGTTATDATPQSTGATSVDMGAGGEGTDIER